MSAFAVPRLVCIVEGDGEVAALPILVRRIAAEVGGYVECPRPVLAHRDRLVRKPGELERAVMLARGKAGERGAILHSS